MTDEIGTSRRTSATRRVRLGAAMVVGALAAAFAILNTDEVKVNWILGSWRTPLIIVIVMSFLLGAAADRLEVTRRARRRGNDADG